MAELTPEKRRVVSGCKQTITEAGGTIEVRLHDKLTALERLGKHLGMFKDTVAVEGDNVLLEYLRIAHEARRCDPKDPRYGPKNPNEDNHD